MSTLISLNLNIIHYIYLFSEKQEKHRLNLDIKDPNYTLLKESYHKDLTQKQPYANYLKTKKFRPLNIF